MSETDERNPETHSVAIKAGGGAVESWFVPSGNGGGGFGPASGPSGVGRSESPTDLVQIDNGAWIYLKDLKPWDKLKSGGGGARPPYPTVVAGRSGPTHLGAVGIFSYGAGGGGSASSGGDYETRRLVEKFAADFVKAADTSLNKRVDFTRLCLAIDAVPEDDQ